MIATVLMSAMLAASGAPGVSGPREGVPPEKTKYPLRAECAANLLELSNWLHTFVFAREGKFPVRLSEVFVDTAETDGRCLVCPAMPLRDADGRLYTSYEYVNVVPGGRIDEQSKGDIILFDSEPVHEGGRNVLVWGAGVQYMAESDFQARLAEERAKYEALGKTLEIVRDDSVPLGESKLMALKADRRSPFGTAKFRIIVALALAIGIVLVLLALQVRRGKRAASP